MTGVLEQKTSPATAQTLAARDWTKLVGLLDFKPGQRLQLVWEMFYRVPQTVLKAFKITHAVAQSVLILDQQQLI